MTTKKKNALWGFFSSVKLALFLLFILAATSIVGTVVPQNQQPAMYVKQYGQNMANLLHILDFTDMYNSWWFLVLLCMFCLNLIICSLERIPTVVRLLKKDNLDTDSSRLRKMPTRKTLVIQKPLAQAVESVSGFLSQNGWNSQQRKKDDGVLLFSQKGGWTRFGVYIVHTSILVIFLGALIGSSTVAKKILHKPDFAFKGSIMLPESRETNYIYSFHGGEKIDLGFTLRCDYFTIEYYSNGMPKTYLSKATIVEDGKTILSTDIKVNTPLTYRGITFYQSSYQPYQDFIVQLTNKTTGVSKTSIVPGGKEINWEESGAKFGILNKKSFGESIQQVKIWFSDDQAAPSTFWVNNSQEAIIKRPSAEYSMTVKQLYATGLQVTKDPGVWFVYVGCGMMLVGLYVAFFMSHRKLYAFIHEEDGQTKVLFSGSAHKNKVGFERTFNGLVDSFEGTLTKKLPE